VLWLKTSKGNTRIEVPYRAAIYVERTPEAETFLSSKNLTHSPVKKLTYLREWKDLYEVPVYDLSKFESFISWIERETQYRLPIYNADLKPEHLFLYERNLVPFTKVVVGKDIVPLSSEAAPKLNVMTLKIIPKKDIRFSDNPVQTLVMNGKAYTGIEHILLRQFVEDFIKDDPDVLLVDHAFSHLPYLVKRLDVHRISCPFHRWDPVPIVYKGGKSFYSYGAVRYQDFAIRLHGRLLVDSHSVIASTCSVDAIIELCQLSGACFQQIASRSFGAVFQAALVRKMVAFGYLVPYKEKPLDIPMHMFSLLKADRAGHTFDARIGFHTDVAEIDFCSMYPWLIFNRNISAETILKPEEPTENVPGIPVTVSLRRKGLVPLAIKPFLDRRMYYKQHPTKQNKERAAGLKWVLVTCYGYLRFREFKLGLASSHMAICAYARDVMMETKELAEARGFSVVHGIIDSLYITKNGISEEEVKDFCQDLEFRTGIPVSSDGILKWVVFLPSVHDDRRPLPARYYGVFRNGEIKARGIEVRQRGVPKIVKAFQQKVLEDMALCAKQHEILLRVPKYCKLLRKAVEQLPTVDVDMLTLSVCLSSTEYEKNIPQRQVIGALQKQGVTVMPGMRVKYVRQENGVALPEQYFGSPDIEYYKNLLVRSLFVLLQPFGITREDIVQQSVVERQTSMREYTDLSLVRVLCLPIPVQYTRRRGMSERYVRRRMEKEGWTVWRGGMINVLRGDDVYLNVRKKYHLLERVLQKYTPGVLEELQYLCSVHHGMPDFLCFRGGQFLFVECKLEYERLSKRQKLCIQKLQKMGFSVEVHRLVGDPTKTREAVENVLSGERIVTERQLTLKRRKTF